MKLKIFKPGGVKPMLNKIALGKKRKRGVDDGKARELATKRVLAEMRKT